MELAAKYWLSLSEEQRPHQRLLLHHAFTLARYDSSVDIRDRARFLRHLLNVHGLAFPTGRTSKDSDPLPTASSDAEEQLPVPPAGMVSEGEKTNREVSGHVRGRVNNNQDRLTNQEVVRRLLLRPKPVPRPPEIAPDRASFLVGTMSHMANHTAPGYQALPEFGAPREAYGIGTDGNDGRGTVGDVRRPSDEVGSEGSEYSGSYESSDGESGSGSGASETEGDLASEAGQGLRDENLTGSVSASLPEGRSEPAHSLDSNVERQRENANGAYEGRTDQELLRKDNPPSNDGKNALLGGSAAPNFVSDLLSAQDLESWLGSLTVSGSESEVKTVTG